MGLFDVFCAESGLVLGGDTDLILLAETGEKRFEPVALPIRGCYNRYGSIDLPSPLDANARRIEAFCARLTFEDPLPDDSFEERLSEMNRAVSEGRWGRAGGRKISFALVDSAVYDAAARTVADGGKPAWAPFKRGALESRPFQELFALAFPRTDAALSVYGPLDAKLEAALRPALQTFVRYRAMGTALSPVDVEDGGQFTGYDEAKNDDGAAGPFVEAALKKYAAYPKILKAIRDCNEAYWKDLDDE